MNLRATPKDKERLLLGWLAGCSIEEQVLLTPIYRADGMRRVFDHMDLSYREDYWTLKVYNQLIKIKYNPNYLVKRTK